MKYHSLIILLLLVFVAGCGNRQLPVQGNVVFSDDGSPLTVGTVIFSNETFQARGALDSQGNFVMGSYGTKDGIPPGTYNVAISGAGIALDEMGDVNYGLIDPKFASPTQSGISVTLDKALRNFEIIVDRNPMPMPPRRGG